MTLLSVIITLLACPLSLLAEDTIKTEWNQLCPASTGRTLFVSTLDGKVFQGNCRYTDTTALHLNRNGNDVSVQRAAIKQITVKDQHRALNAVWRFFGGTLVLFAATPDSALLGVVVVPVALAAGAIASPFAFIIDLLDFTDGTAIDIRAL